MGAPYRFGRWVTSGAQLPPGLGAFGALSAVRLDCQVTEGRLRGRRGSGPKRGVCTGGRGRDTSPTNGWGGSDGMNDPRGLERQPERGGHMGRGGWKVAAPGTGGRDQAVWMWKVLRPREESRGKRRTRELAEKAGRSAPRGDCHPGVQRGQDLQSPRRGLGGSQGGRGGGWQGRGWDYLPRGRQGPFIALQSGSPACSTVWVVISVRRGLRKTDPGQELTRPAGSFRLCPASKPVLDGHVGDDHGL